MFKFNLNIHKLQEYLFDFVIYASWIVYFLFLAGILTQEPKYLKIIHEYLPIYISLFLIIRFNPFRSVKFTKYDQKIVFYAGTLIFTTSLINNLFIFK